MTFSNLRSNTISMCIYPVFHSVSVFLANSGCTGTHQKNDIVGRLCKHASGDFSSHYYSSWQQRRKSGEIVERGTIGWVGWFCKRI